MKKYLPLQLTLLLIAGILLQYILIVSVTLILIALSLSLIAAVSIYFLTDSVFRVPAIIILCVAAAIAAGMLSFSLNRRDVKIGDSLDEGYSKVIVYGAVEYISLYHTNTFQMEIEADSIKTSRGSVKVTGLIMVNVKNENGDTLAVRYNALNPGDAIIVGGRFSRGKRCRNPGEFDYAEYLAWQGFHGMLNCGGNDTLVTTNDHSSLFDRIRHEIRKVIARKTDKTFDKETAALLKGLLLGDKREIAPEVQTAFINSGTAHVLAVSGLNVTYFAYLAYLLLGRFSFRTRNTGAAAAMILFWFVAGSSPPVVRAVICGLLFIGVKLMNRKVKPVNIIALSAMCIVLIDPCELFTASFLLTYAGVLSLVIVYPALTTLLENMPDRFRRVKGLALMILLTLAAQIGVTPVTSYYFGAYSLTALFSNLAVVPLTALIMGAGMLTLIINQVLPLVGHTLAGGTDLLTGLTYTITTLAGKGSWTHLTVSSFTFEAAVCYYLILGVYLCLMNGFQSIRAKILLSLQLAVLLAIVHVTFNKDALPESRMNILAVDVGQGDAILICFPDNKSLLIDAGNANKYFDCGEQILLPLLEHLGIEKLDYAIITHPDADHCGGIAALLRQKKISTVIKQQLVNGARIDSLIEELVKVSGAKLINQPEQPLMIGGARIYFLLTARCGTVKNKPGMNDNSICVKIQYGKTTAIFTGDSQQKREQELISMYDGFLKCDILKVAHHGSKFGSTECFLNKLQPGKAIISVGRTNIYGHPNKEVLERLAACHVEVYRTDLSGALGFSTDGACYAPLKLTHGILLPVSVAKVR